VGRLRTQQLRSLPGQTGRGIRGGSEAGCSAVCSGFGNQCTTACDPAGARCGSRGLPGFEDDKTIAVTTYVKGAFVSEDGGGTWGFANEGLTVDDCGTGKRFAPLRRLGGVVLSPDYAKDGTIVGADWVAQHDPSSGRRL
jgi:hypothetical protein